MTSVFSSWKHTIHVEGVLYADEIPFGEKCVAVADRVRCLHCPGDDEMCAIADSLEHAATQSEFDRYWDDLYAWTAAHSVWVQTR